MFQYTQIEFLPKFSTWDVWRRWQESYSHPDVPARDAVTVFSGVSFLLFFYLFSKCSWSKHRARTTCLRILPMCYDWQTSTCSRDSFTKVAVMPSMPVIIVDQLYHVLEQRWKKVYLLNYFWGSGANNIRTSFARLWPYGYRPPEIMLLGCQQIAPHGNPSQNEWDSSLLWTFVSQAHAD